MNTYERNWETNGIKAHTTKKGVVVENWNRNQGRLTGRKILIIGGLLPTDDDWMTYLDKLKYAEHIDNVKILRKGHIVE